MTIVGHNESEQHDFLDPRRIGERLARRQARDAFQGQGHRAGLVPRFAFGDPVRR